MIPFYVKFTGTFFLPLTVPYLGGAWFRWVGAVLFLGGEPLPVGPSQALWVFGEPMPAYLAQAQWRPFWVFGAAWVAMIAWSLVENALRGPIPESELAGKLNVHDLGRSGTPEKVQQLAAVIPATARLRTDNLKRGVCGTPSNTPWYSHPTTFELIAVTLMSLLLVWLW